MTMHPIETKLIPLDQVHPDPAQPRHLLPPDLADALVNGTSPSEILSQLRSRAERDKWVRERLAELDALAGSIGADGLMQPIRVIRESDDSYQIEEGERRCWAHHILVQQGKGQFQTIAAFVVEKESKSSGLLRRRVAENVLRSGFTAIELAKAMSSRIQEILAAEPGIKRNEAERRVGSENNMSDRRVRQYVALLTLTPEVQELAQQARLSESALRSLVGIKEADRQLAMAHELAYPSRKRRPSAKRPGASKTARAKVPASKRKPVGRARKPIVARPTATRRSGLRKDSRQVVHRCQDEGWKGLLCRLVAISREMQSMSLDDLQQQNLAAIITSPSDARAVHTMVELMNFALSLVADHKRA